MILTGCVIVSSLPLSWRFTDSFGAAPPTTTDAYIIYCLVMAGIPGMEKEVDYLVELTKDETFGDTYVIGLTAATLYRLGRFVTSNLC